MSAWDGARARTGAHPLEDSFGLTAEGCEALRALGCRHDVDFLVLLMREARDGVGAIEAWLRAHASGEVCEEGYLPALAAELACTVNARLCTSFYPDMDV